MKETKFRAWDKENKIYYKECDWLCFKPGGIRFMWTDYKTDEQMVTDLKDGSFVLMQYTGLKDKNGIEIYEGDMVEHSHHKDTFIVEWNDKGAGFIGVYSNGRDTLYKVDSEIYEVVGNIYENKGS